MNRRARGPIAPRVKPAPKPQKPWLIRTVVIVAVVIVAVAVIYAAVNGVLFTTNTPK